MVPADVHDACGLIKPITGVMTMRTVPRDAVVITVRHHTPAVLDVVLLKVPGVAWTT